MNIVHLLEKSVNRAPEHPAVVFRGETITYEALFDKVKEKANGLLQNGVRSGMHVGLMMANRPDYMITYFSLLSVGAIVIPINPMFKSDEVAYILNDSEAKAIIFDEVAKNAVLDARPQLNDVTSYFLLGQPTEAGVKAWGDVHGDAAGFRIEEKEKEDTAQIIYTSGTTGKPKGAMITHGNLNWMTIASADIIDLQPTDRILVVLPLYHAYAKLQGMLQPISRGATIYLEERFIPDAILETMGENDISVFLGVPTMYTMFVRSPKVKEYDFSALRIAGSGGASLPVEIIEKVRQEMGVDIGEGYGQTESTVMISCYPKDAPRKPGSVGLPVPGIELKIVDPNDREVPQGEIGEIIFKGPNGMKGYYKKQEETEQTIRNGWVYTGDLGRQDEEGYLYIVDRKKDMIIRGGYNVYPREVEEVLYTHPDIVEAAVVGETDDVFGEEVAAYIVTSKEVTPEEIKAFCKERMAPYKIPRKIYFLEELPKNATGKILKTPLRKQNTVSK